MSSTRVQKRLRIFAGPNGSGKSTIINSIRNTKVAGWPIDFGIYINADDIARLLRSNKFSFASYGLQNLSRDDFVATTLKSGLVGTTFTEKLFRQSFSISKDSKLILKSKKYHEEIAQILADYLRRKLLDKDEKISFEAVFSHQSKLDFMRDANSRGYKTYLYFVSTESPDINLSRIKEIRVPSGGHDVPEDKIISRYHRSMNLLYEASKLTYQTYFFDNSHAPSSSNYFAHFKFIKGNRQWDLPKNQSLPDWFFRYYVSKQRSSS